ncbi:MAG: hypothetical protein MI784_03685 [Cytophagales bacterium]|nr:hypothetical protein [Cytophagales bacterium]
MERFLIVLFLVCLSFGVHAQSVESSPYPAKKSVMFEVNFKPFGKDEVISFKQLRGKYWIGNRTVLRLGFEYDSKTNESSESLFDIAPRYKYSITENTALWGVSIGFEYRPLGSRKVSPYIGGDLTYRVKSSEALYESFTHFSEWDSSAETDRDVYRPDTYEVKNGWRSQSVEYCRDRNGWKVPEVVTDYDSERAFSAWGVALVGGVDINVMKNVYLGVEIGLNHEIREFDKVEISHAYWEKKSYYSSYNSKVTVFTSKKEESSRPSYSKGSTKLYCNSAIRLGFWF